SHPALRAEHHRRLFGVGADATGARSTGCCQSTAHVQVVIGHARLSLTGRVLVVTLLTLLWGQNAHAFPRAAVVTPVVHRTYSHDPTAFTQGLLFWQGR